MAPLVYLLQKFLKEIGCEVIELDCNLDYNFPKYNPNPEDLKMLESYQ